MSSRVALPVLMWSVSAAGADESPANPPVIELEVLTVTATKTERSAFEVPASVSIIGPERIESEQPQSIGDLLEELPNVELLSGPRRIGETANIRGFDEERIVTIIDGAMRRRSAPPVSSRRSPRPCIPRHPGRLPGQLLRPQSGLEA